MAGPGDARWDDRFEHIVRENVTVRTEEPLTPDVSLANLGLDSLKTVGLLIAVEAEYGISVPDEMLDLDTFATPGALWAVVQQLRDGRGEG